MLVDPRIEVKIHGARRRAWEDILTSVPLQLTIKDSVASVRLFFVSLKCVVILLRVVVLEPVHLTCIPSISLSVILEAHSTLLNYPWKAQESK